MYLVHERRGVRSWTGVGLGVNPGLYGEEWLWRTIPTSLVGDVQAHVRTQCTAVLEHLQAIWPGAELAWRQGATRLRDPTPRMLYHIEVIFCINDPDHRPAVYLFEFVVDGPDADDLPRTLLDLVESTQ